MEEPEPQGIGKRFLDTVRRHKTAVLIVYYALAYGLIGAGIVTQPRVTSAVFWSLAYAIGVLIVVSARKKTPLTVLILQFLGVIFLGIGFVSALRHHRSGAYFGIGFVLYLSFLVPSIVSSIRCEVRRWLSTLKKISDQDRASESRGRTAHHS